MPDLLEFVPERASPDRSKIALARWLGPTDLFDVGNAVDTDIRVLQPATGHRPDALFALPNGLTVIVATARVRASVFQCFLLALAERFGQKPASTGRVSIIDPDCGLAVVAAENDRSFVEEAARIWDRLCTGGSLAVVEAATIPKLYGSKARLTEFVWAAAAACLPDDVPILDVMSGTGAVTRVLSRRFRVSANDANPYAVTLTQAQSLDFEDDAGLLRSRLRAVADENADRLRKLTADAVFEEEGFFNNDFDEGNRLRYVSFCANPVLPPLDRRPADGAPYQLCLRGYANVYLGVAQAIDADSIRKAIDAETQEGSQARIICLAALLGAVSACNSGPHFAQPRGLNSVRAFKHVVERRARSLRFEFERMLDRYAARPRSGRAAPTTATDWPEALRHFAIHNLDDGERAVYIDPPYSKLQYSRYYHLLNTLVAYDYPPLSLTGRYPPVDQRFSSRFEYRASSARKEFDRLFNACADIGATVVLSYSDTGFVPINDLVRQLGTRFARVHLLSESIRHHAQGKPIARASAVTEFIIVARCPAP
ncbi:DNA adenine methylase [Methylobacterium fujisawaense]|uniref:DNA adenine methylase n=1 Tax=Methylobacterium fujisawaense TaxID=107400 RepID=UPI00244D1D8E|nr:DNA adenine methylase [Methylobacterium fujisawaense]MDH3030144.1 DNA adenine methylase [Methylobacterium fujisawaense]